VEDVYGMGIPIKFSAASAGFDQPPPELGQHNDFVYGGILGYSRKQLSDLKTRGVI
jgi:CoA:oxalate CoA-transferase